jgi:hypothetical protein
MGVKSSQEWFAKGKAKIWDTKISIACETVEKGWRLADSPPMKKFPPEVISVIKII